jgi:7-cyano-7-deazaguanine synthase
MDQLLALQEGELRLFAPYVNIEAAELVRSSAIPLAMLAWSHSCHRGNLACGECRGCLKHRAVFEDVFGS